MRLATFNILHGRSLDDGTVDEGRLRDAAITLDADVLGLQEVDRWQPRSLGLDMTDVVAGAMGAAAWRFVPTIVGTPGGLWRAADAARPARGSGAVPTDLPTYGDPDDRDHADHADDADDADDADGREPAYGVALISRLPVREWRLVRLPAAPVRSPVLVPGTARPVMLLDEPRAGIAAVVDTAAGPMTVCTTHLSFVPGWNAVQLRRLTAALRDLPQPVVLLGDLNLPGRVPQLASGWRQLARVATYPSWRPRVQLDHVLARGKLPAPTAVRAVRLPLSDHSALVVDVPLPPSELAP